MNAPNPLAGLPRLTDTALGPCAICDRVMLATEFPLFFRINLKRCGIDSDEVARHVGLARSNAPGQDGLHLAAIMGPGCKPVVVMDEWQDFNCCHGCASTATVESLFIAAMAREESAAGDER